MIPVIFDHVAAEEPSFRLADLQSPPAGASHMIAPNELLRDAAGKSITAIKDWEKKREQLQAAWIKHLGPMATVRKAGQDYPAPEIEVLEEVVIDGFLRKKIRYATEPGQKSRAYLLIPEKTETPMPAIVFFHGTNPLSYHQGPGVFGVDNRATAYHLAKRGYVVICPQNSIWPESDEIQLDYRRVTEEFRKRNPENRGMARMILDGQIAVDILVSLKEVDANRIGCTGHSLGGKQALYLPAFDERVVCSVSSEGGIGVEQSNWEADWYLGPDVKKPDFPLNHAEIVAMIAPRPFLGLGGDASDGAATWPYMEAALPVYRLYGEPPLIGLFNHKQGHSLPPDAEQLMYDWFDCYLANRGVQNQQY